LWVTVIVSCSAELGMQVDWKLEPFQYCGMIVAV